MRGSRRFSQAIAEGDGISLLADVRDAAAAEGAEAAGAEGVVVRGELTGLRDATELPILWYGHASIEAAMHARADATLLVVEGLEDEDTGLERLYADALESGLECVVAVRTEEQLRLVLERLDPEIVLLRAGAAAEEAAFEQVLGLLADVPAGKLAIADFQPTSGEQVAELERAGIDAVIVRSADVARLLDEARAV